VLLRGGLEWPIRHRSVPWHSGIRVVLTSLGIQSVLQKKVQLLNLRRVDLDRVFEHSPMHALNAGRLHHCAFVLVIILSKETKVRVCHCDWDKESGGCTYLRIGLDVPVIRVAGSVRERCVEGTHGGFECELLEMRIMEGGIFVVQLSRRRSHIPIECCSKF
jgi:hypothetical protein